MRVLIYHPWIYLRGGAERTILEMVKRSRHDCTVATSYFNPEGTFPEFRDLNVLTLGHSSTSRNYRAVLRSFLAITTATIPRDQYDVVLISSEGMGDFFCMANSYGRNMPAVVFCHTPLKVIHDPYERELYLDTHGFIDRTMYRVGSFLFIRIDQWAWKRYQKIIANSEEVKRRIAKAGLAEKSSIEVAHPGVVSRSNVRSHNRQPIILVPGRIAPSKNLELAIMAFGGSRLGSEGWSLVVAGGLDSKRKSYFEYLQRLSQSVDGVQFIVNPDDKVMSDLMEKSSVGLFTARNEDWGIVILEMMQAGLPVVAVNRGGPVEMIHNGVDGLLVDPDPQLIAETVWNLVNSGGTVEMGRRAQLKAANYEWESFVRQVDNGLDEVGSISSTIMKARTVNE